MTVDGFLIAHGSALILPLAVVEGPIVSIATGFLSARGFFDWYWALFLLVCGDLIGDLICYAIGHSSRGPLSRLGRLVGVGSLLTPELRRSLTHSTAKMLFIGKWTHSIGCLVLVGSGMLRVKLSTFLVVNLLATIPKSAVLFGFGYFAGGSWPFLEHHVVLTIIALCVIGLAAILVVLRRACAISPGGAGR